MIDNIQRDQNGEDIDNNISTSEDIVLIMRISMDNGTVDLPIPRNSKPLDLALNFCGKHRLPADKVLDLMKHIEQQLAMLVPTVNPTGADICVTLINCLFAEEFNYSDTIEKQVR